MICVTVTPLFDRNLKEKMESVMLSRIVEINFTTTSFQNNDFWLAGASINQFSQ